MFFIIYLSDTSNHIGGFECVPIIGRVSMADTLSTKVHEAIFSFLFQTITGMRYGSAQI